MLAETISKRRAMDQRYKEILCRLFDVSRHLPEDFGLLRELAERMSEALAGADRRIDDDAQCDRHELAEMGFLLLKLARPAIPETRAEVADQIDILVTKIEAGIVSMTSVDEDDIPY